MRSTKSPLPAATEPRGGAEPSRGRQAILLVGLLGGVFVVGVLLASLYLGLSYRPPVDDSAEAGFARDMAVHHAQAVQMAGIVQRRTESDGIRLLATDVALTQQAQIGQMQGWLAAWRLSQTGDGPAMSWMGHPTEGLMPGMATPEEVSTLETLPPDEADEQFLRLLIPHHEAAIPMAEAVLAETDRPEVRELAIAIASSQRSEILMMQDLLKNRGAVPTEETPTGDAPHADHEH